MIVKTEDNSKDFFNLNLNYTCNHGLVAGCSGSLGGFGSAKISISDMRIRTDPYVSVV